MENTKLLKASLYLLPVGLSDAPVEEIIPRRNIEIMRELRHFIVENVRTARRWIRKCLPDFSFDSVEFYELNKRTPHDDLAAMLDPLRKGEPMGLMSEAGCPAVADPGADIVTIAQRERLQVVPLVGPSSILMSLMGSGFNGQSFSFVGYLPIDDKEKRARLRELEKKSEREDSTQIFIETPYRNNRLLALLGEVLLPDTLLCVAAGITDPEKEIIVTRTAAEWRKSRFDYSDIPAIFLIYRRSGDNRRKKR